MPVGRFTSRPPPRFAYGNVYRIASSGAAVITADAAITEGADTLSSTAAALIAGASAMTEGADTLSATAVALVAATAAATESADTLSSTGVSLIAGAVAVTEGADTLSADASSDAPDAAVEPVRFGGIGPRRVVPIEYVEGSIIDYLTKGEQEENPAPRRRIKKAEIVATIEESAEYIAAGRPLIMSPKAMVAQISAVPEMERLLELDRQRVAREIAIYVAARLAEEEEEEEAFAMLLAA